MTAILAAAAPAEVAMLLVAAAVIGVFVVIDVEEVAVSVVVAIVVDAVVFAVVDTSGAQITMRCVTPPKYNA